MRLWKPYERTVEALYCHGSLTPEEEGQYLRLHQAIGDTPTCIVPSYGNLNKSDTPAIHAAFKKCGKGGRIIFKENTTYALNELTILTPCKSCTVELEGTLRLSDNITYWLKNATNPANLTSATYPNLVYYPFQDTFSYLILKDWKKSSLVSKTGKGLIDGAGQLWWNAFAGQEALDPEPCQLVQLGIDSKYLNYTNIRLSALSTNKNPPKNADGWDTYRTSHFVLRGAHVVSGDDCFNSHGVSVGSLAQYPGVLDRVEHVKVKYYFCRKWGQLLKWCPYQDLGRTVGSAIVNDIHYEDLTVDNVTNPLVVDSCYFSQAYCATGKPVASITDVTVTNIRGNSTGAVVSSIICPEGSTCDIKFKNVDIKPKNGAAPVYRCFSVTSEDLGVNCTYPTIVNGTFKWPA
ncbi:polygalacturonase [Rhizoctonia solani]|uniref:galacturonan 1,4-alpha-galacturonidase n=1 Tax=Rhizoctonia solani TaxID=456999 RepID=A0A8H8P3T8_9AGAM|nr:polygalacturonase [Rhizoctonia solani]QRW25009.1 polygalacturonase [Rhizoctonia solani]